MNKKPYYLPAIIFSLLLPATALSQTPSQPPRLTGPQTSEIRINQIDTSSFPKVTIFATVYKDSAPLEGLVAKDFRVREDEVDQEPLTVEPQLSSLNAVITLDTSGSIKKALPQVQTAAINFLDSLSDTDKFDVITFSRDVKTISSDGNKPQAKQAIQQTIARGDTALFDAIYQSIAALKDRKGRKAVVLLTDGVDDDGTGKQLSKHSLDEAVELAKTVNAPVFAIGLGLEKDVQNLEKIATATGGKYYDAVTPEQLAGIYNQIGREITGQYNIYYTSNLPADGSIHRVNLNHADLQGIKEYQSPALEAVKVAAVSSTVVVAQSTSIVSIPSQDISTKPGLNVAVRLSENTGKIAFDRIEVFAKPASDFETPVSVEKCFNNNSHCSFNVKPRQYRITAKKGDATASVDTEVKADIANNVWVTLNAGLLRVAGIPAEGAQPTDLKRILVSSKPASAFDKSYEAAKCYDSKMCEFFLNAGTYNVEAKRGSAVAYKEVQVNAAGKTDVTINLNASVLNVSALSLQNGPPIKLQKLTVFKVPENGFDKPVEVEYIYDCSKCSFILNAGKYLLKSKFANTETDAEVELLAGQQLDKVLVLEAK